MKYLKALIAVCMCLAVIDGYLVLMCHDTTMKFYEHWGQPGQAAEKASAHYRVVSERYALFACLMTIGLVFLVGFIVKRRCSWPSE